MISEERDRDIERRLTSHTKQIEAHDHRIGALERGQGQLSTLTNQLTVLVTEMTAIKTTVNDIDKRLRDHEMMPANNWSKLMWIIGSAIAGAVLALVINKIGLGG